MNKVYIISGPPGVGKSTVSLQLAKKLEKSVHIDGDTIYHQVVNGYFSPWEDNNHLDILYKIIVASTNIYLDNGYDVVIDYLLDYDDYLYISKQINSNNVFFNFLIANKETLINRDFKRAPSKKIGDRIIKVCDEIEDYRIPLNCFIDTNKMSIEEIVLSIIKNGKNAKNN